MPPLPTLLLLTLLTLTTSTTPPNLIAVILARDRTSHLKKTLRSFATATIPLHPPIPVHVSIDDNPKAYRVIRAAQHEPNVASIWRHTPNTPSKNTRIRIAQHYHFVLSKAFSTPSVTHLLLLEDDLLLSPDALLYIRATLPHLSGPFPNHLVCASLWNDNARHPQISSSTATLTTFFPGLGWALSRPFFHNFLNHSWPTGPAVGIGWDFWLRLQFEARNWSCLTPHLPRVRHFGATGTHVRSEHADHIFANFPSADLPPATVAWPRVVQHAADVDARVAEIQKWLMEGTVIDRLDAADKVTDGKPALLPYLREEYAALADRLGLWPTPRGHFRHTIRVVLASGNVLLLYDRRRAGAYFTLPGVRGDAMGAVKLVLGERGASCDETCAGEGMRCVEAGLEEVNFCDGMASIVDGGCGGRCAFETGEDLPAFVVEEAPLATKGLCLVAETGSGEGGALDCAGRFEWTRRGCGCVDVTSGEKDEL